mmetsp:Transcript_10643/g.22548  ORF Transcript_10643/g.22548 Transcript_10643/m.22548 type:complete len:87 (-) Transcript_10643:19-279(-)
MNCMMFNTRNIFMLTCDTLCLSLSSHPCLCIDLQQQPYRKQVWMYDKSDSIDTFSGHYYYPLDVLVMTKTLLLLAAVTATIFICYD